ncbi:propanediol/glycerol family dehydratase large subunit, partial [Klebsiella pneumoniae]|uniref:propanediol/glycerol family dehydratase large subunit n=1 Tax=Klebsiella pneumoniae TaxID=573 RepID=UPI00272F0E4B
RAVLAENLICSALALECASSNDQTFTHSDMRRTARLLMQVLPGTDFISSGYSAVPNYDNSGFQLLIPLLVVMLSISVM